MVAFFLSRIHGPVVVYCEMKPGDFIIKNSKKQSQFTESINAVGNNFWLRNLHIVSVSSFLKSPKFLHGIAVCVYSNKNSSFEVIVVMELMTRQLALSR